VAADKRPFQVYTSRPPSLPAASSSPAAREAVEGADLVIDAGGVSFDDNNTSAYSSRIAPEKLVTIDVDHVRIKDRVYNPVGLDDVLEMLTKSLRKNFGYQAPRRETKASPGGKPNDPITAAALYPRYRDFLKPLDQIVLESGSSTSGIVPLPLPDGAEVHCQPLWGSIGWPPSRRYTPARSGPPADSG
jgi:indolepyruvate decarboxylase